jgi:hypothetical protein
LLLSDSFLLLSDSLFLSNHDSISTTSGHSLSLLRPFRLPNHSLFLVNPTASAKLVTTNPIG